MPNVVGEGGSGQVRVELDGAGRVRHVEIAEPAMEMSAGRLSEELTVAFQAAQDRVLAAAAELPASERVAAAAAAATEAAERRFGEISTALYDLSRRAEREW